MAAPKGHPRYGGRKKGTPNKKTAGIQSEIEARLGKSMPLAILDELADLDASERAHILLDLMKYVYPTRKAIEHSVDVPPEVLDKFEELNGMSDKDLKKIVKGE